VSGSDTMFVSRMRRRKSVSVIATARIDTGALEAALFCLHLGYFGDILGTFASI
jgi:hypothetical protein